MSMSKYRKYHIVKATVTGIESYGVFVSLDEYYTGLIHISEITNGFVRDINDYVKVGDIICVKILDVDNDLGHLRLSIKDIDYQIGKKRLKKIKETEHGFDTLKSKLDEWKETKLEEMKKNQ